VPKHERSTYFFEEIPTFSSAFALLLHVTSDPNTHITRLDASLGDPVFSWGVPLLFVLDGSLAGEALELQVERTVGAKAG
jgi:hypothetical protein